MKNDSKRNSVNKFWTINNEFYYKFELETPIKINYEIFIHINPKKKKKYSNFEQLIVTQKAPKYTKYVENRTTVWNK